MRQTKHQPRFFHLFIQLETVVGAAVLPCVRGLGSSECYFTNLFATSDFLCWMVSRTPHLSGSARMHLAIGVKRSLFMTICGSFSVVFCSATFADTDLNLFDVEESPPSSPLDQKFSHVPQFCSFLPSGIPIMFLLKVGHHVRIFINSHGRRLTQ